MIRLSEMVLPGHPDKFCDQIADAVISECVRIDKEAYGQVEVAVWSDRVWLSGGIVTKAAMDISIEDIVVETGRKVGYINGNYIDVEQYIVENTVCASIEDPTRWSHHVNDQSIVIGWAGYDARTHFLPPEHFIGHVFRDAIIDSCNGGLLSGHGPDGKILVRVREEESEWRLEHLLITIQQLEATSLLDVCSAVSSTIQDAYNLLRKRDSRWRSSWEQVELMINPNGPLLNGGSDGDNGQTGRKLAVDFYGPRIPIGGGALSGKHISHIDRIGAYAARDAAVRAVKSGSEECMVRLCYAPNVSTPLDISFEMIGRGQREAESFFDHQAMVERYSSEHISSDLGKGIHFYKPDLPWNGVETGKTSGTQ